MSPVIMSLIAVMVIMCVAAAMAVYGDSKVLSRLMEGITRQPEAKDALFTNALVSCGLIESMPIIATVVVLILIFANPLLAK
ncbi:ATP synthase F0 subunit C [Schwartzia succinivorans]|jgi:F-type H+-transporting ATPase subunit c|uniref:ATP synthase F(0) sector subunit c n=1 Tax=Schwartzia succinivorans DSM 10502 TaxID=1123243 RepID=A0A1M4XH85_9FIRM|nr:ATP synthase F0 subunit C [Schwartzia succinivorans]MBQ1917812.1 ATP synthase F0 subunit C [Schwartzia sp. (in: firmicutes)]MBE6098068.1 ATP synthase F0 subunit C [Schwartzia succinivorans]MBQ2048410.1 ATP synthase F0 subunit C [Schwartzia sp. (in: firmicutes)]MBQ3862558.1 ATP synthase F0 subunit C [Schwartzia sp. (in: firmicutes)]SHE92768.1 F-type H+-transporting ATPase subunit c [Schwartzia succinivorans DSM 10502]